jgi:hypothetical protein
VAWVGLMWLGMTQPPQHIYFFLSFIFFSEEKKYIGKWWFGKYIESCRGLENGSTLHHVVPMV